MPEVVLWPRQARAHVTRVRAHTQTHKMLDESSRLPSSCAELVVRADDSRGTLEMFCSFQNIQEAFLCQKLNLVGGEEVIE